MPGRSFSSEDIAKLKKLFNEGSRVLREMEDLKEGLKETCKKLNELSEKGWEVYSTMSAPNGVSKIYFLRKKKN